MREWESKGYVHGLGLPRSGLAEYYRHERFEATPPSDKILIYTPTNPSRRASAPGHRVLTPVVSSPNLHVALSDLKAHIARSQNPRLSTITELQPGDGTPRHRPQIHQRPHRLRTRLASPFVLLQHHPLDMRPNRRPPHRSLPLAHRVLPPSNLVSRRSPPHLLLQRLGHRQPSARRG